MGVPVIYRKSGEGAIATYDFFDLGTGRGIKTLDAGDASGAYILTAQQFYGWDGFTRKTNTLIDLDFDMTFNNPILVKGSAIVQFTGSTFRVSGGSTGVTSIFTTYLRKVPVGLTEVDLASAAYVLSATLNDGEVNRKLIAFNLDIPKTHFAIGDTLRLTVQASAPGTAKRATIYHDPKNRTFSEAATNTISSRCELHLPVVIDI